jgi:hypothetical protein
MQEICSLVTTMTKGTRLLHAVGLAIVVVACLGLGIT